MVSYTAAPVSAMADAVVFTAGVTAQPPSQSVLRKEKTVSVSQ